MITMKSYEVRFYATFPSPFNTFTIVWKETGLDLQVKLIFLSDPTQIRN